jgi:hypothetical protein
MTTPTFIGARYDEAPTAAKSAHRRAGRTNQWRASVERPPSVHVAPTTMEEKRDAPQTKSTPKVLGWAGLLLMGLGCLSLALVYLSDGADVGAIRQAAGAGVLWALGTSTAAVAGLQRLEARVAKLEALATK